LLPDEIRDGVVGHERDAALFAALSNPNEPPIAQLLAFVIVTAAEAKVWVAATLREPEKLRGAL
jgi:hypothetical protein